jgi:hypothetical protein
MNSRHEAKQIARQIGRWCGWAALILLLLTMLTGYGISEFRTVSSLTLGALNKAFSHKLHHYAGIPLLVLVLAHVSISMWGRLVASKIRSE